MTNEYQPGDLVEATLGDTIIRGRITGCSGDYVGNSRRTVGALLDDNFTLNVIEKAKPKVELPSEPGTVITWRDGAYLPQIAVLDPSTPGMGWRHNKDVDGHWFTPGAMAHEINGVEFTRLEPRAVTAKAVLDEVGKFAWADGFTTQIEATAKKFGVRSNA